MVTGPARRYPFEDALLTLTNVTRVVAAAQLEVDAAKSEQAAASVQLLEAVIAMVLPALPSVSEHHEMSCGMPDDELPDETVLTAKAGISLAGGLERDSRGDSMRGDFVGEELILWTDGTMSQLVYSGEWSQRPRESSHWMVEQIRAMTLSEVVAEYNVDALIEALGTRLEVAARRSDQMHGDAAAIRARAKRMTQVAAQLHAA